LEALTGHPVRHQYKLPWEADVLPAADAMLVCPATSNTINKWAQGISDTLALGLITEAIGKGLALVALPYCNLQQASHPAFGVSVRVLRSAAVSVLLDDGSGDGDGGFVPHSAGSGAGASERPAYPWAAGVAALSRVR
jgi:phosphopantothenoylcysteine synthetase/decarboxylase